MIAVSGDLAKILYWACVVWPLVGGIGILACDGKAIRARCHIVVSIVLIVITICSAGISDDFFLSVVWSNDSLTRFLRVLIAIGVGVSTLLLRLWTPRSLLFEKEDKRQLWALLLFHFLVAIAMLAVAVNNFFITLLLLVILAASFMGACAFNHGETSIKAGWVCFRYIVLLMILSLIGAFLLGLVSKEQAPLLAGFSSTLLSLGIVLAAGLFPLSLSYLRLTTELPLALGSLSSFILPLPFIATFIRLHQIQGYESPKVLLIALVLLSLLFVVIKERDKHNSPLLLSSAFLVAFSIFGGIFSDQSEGVYIACLFMSALVIFAPLSYMMSKKNLENHACFEGWIMLALSGFPPIGIFMACFALISYLMVQLPVIGWGVLILLFIRGYCVFQKGRGAFFAIEGSDKEARVIIGLLVFQTILFPLLMSNWMHIIAIAFTSQHGAST